MKLLLPEKALKSIMLLLCSFLMQYTLYSMLPIKLHKTKAKLIEKQVPVLPPVLCVLIANYAKEWRDQSSITTSHSFRAWPIDYFCPIKNASHFQMIACSHDIIFYDFTTKEQCEFPAIVGTMVYAPKSKILVTLSPTYEKNARIKLYNVENITTNIITTKKFLNNHCTTLDDFPIEKLNRPAIAPCESKFAFGQNNRISIFSFPDGKLLKNIDVWKTDGYSLCGGSICNLSWNYNSTFLVLSREHSNTLTILNAEKPSKRAEIKVFDGGDSKIIAFACSPKENIVVVKTIASLACFNLACGKKHWSTKVSDKARSLSFSPDGTLVASALDGFNVYTQLQKPLVTIGVWDVTDGTIIASFLENDPEGAVAFLSDDILMIAADPKNSATKPVDIFLFD